MTGRLTTVAAYAVIAAAVVLAAALAWIGPPA